MYKPGAALRGTRSMADLTSDVNQCQHGHQAIHRSGSSGAILDLPSATDITPLKRLSVPSPAYLAVQPACSPSNTRLSVKRSSTPNIAQLADKIVRAELSKLQKVSGPNRHDSRQRSLSLELADWHGDGTEVDRISSGGVDSGDHVPSIRSHGPVCSPPADYGEVEGSFFAPDPVSQAETARNIPMYSRKSAMQMNIAQPESELSDADTICVDSLIKENVSSVSPRFHEKATYSSSVDVSRPSFEHDHLGPSRPLFASPSVPQLIAGKLSLRPAKERRRSTPTPAYSDKRSDVGQWHPPSPSHFSDEAAQGFSNSMVDMRTAGSLNGSPPVPPPRPNKRIVAKRYSVPTMLEADLEDLREDVALSEMHRWPRSKSSQDVTSTFSLPRSVQSEASSTGVPLFSSPPPPPSPPPPLPLHPPPPLPPGSVTGSNSSSLRRKALGTLTLTNSNSSSNSIMSASSSTQSLPSTHTSSINTASTADCPLPAISVTEHQSPPGSFNLHGDCPHNDLSPTSDQLYPPTHSPLSQLSAESNDIYKSVSEVTSNTYNISHKSGAGMDDTRSTNTDSILDEQETAEHPGSWRPYDVFQISERETEDDGAVFREILKVLRLVLYVFIILAVLTGTVASRLSLFLLTAGISQSEETKGECTVMLLMCLCAPIVFSWFFSFVKILFSGKQWPTFTTLLFLLTVELLQTFGVCLLLFRILPVIDFFRGITITLATFQLPSLFKVVLMERKLDMGVWNCVKGLTAVMAMSTQVAAIAFFLMTSFPGRGVDATIPRGNLPNNPPALSTLVWELPLALVLVSLGWWENYVSGQWSLCGKVTLSLKRARKVVQDVRDTATFLVSPFKVGLAVALAKYLTGATFSVPQQADHDSTDSVMYHLTSYSLLYLQLGASLLMTYLATLACKLHMQRAAFALPLLLSPPLSLAFVYLQCRYDFLPGQWHAGLWLCPSLTLEELLVPLCSAGALWVSYCLVVGHVWFPSSERMAKVEKLFITPHIHSVFPDFHLTLRRRRNDHELRASRFEEFSYVGEDNPYVQEPDSPKDDVTPLVYVCATMWHETQREMTQLLKSLFRLDYVHCASKLAQDKFNIKDPDYYDLEIHVLFDDAFELDDEADRYVPNTFVRQLIECMEDAARSVLKGPIDIPPPVKTATPYGGVLVWTMPGQTKMYVHLKNKNQIRHRKRWSQCMYLYYLLGYRLLGGKDDTQSDTMSDNDSDQKHNNVRHRGDKPNKAKTKPKRRKMAAMPLRSLLGHMTPDKYEKTIQMSEHTFILTLDGDVDFKPDSVRLLLDRMKKNKKVGAVCGRIHPIGSGPMVWYQQFEYAVGHWLQKASEHVFGCVLCCPGCFSLFRGSALMDDNVIKKYTTKPTEASHYIQFEQGEDRWLCTLLLQQGHRIDYCAGADALTFAPETFNEFFNQRRRWSPSTLANMMDLLASWRETVRINDNISRLYILYQFLLMASSILAPSTVILMITGSYHSVLGMTMWWSFVLSLAPVMFYLGVCLTQKNDVQIKVGAVLTAIYTVVMMIATVGTLISIATESFSSPNVVFLSGLFVIFFVASMLHPQEFFCLVYGALYFLVVPSTFILLTVYYLCNLNNVSWGTREMPKKLTPDEEEAQRKAEEEKVKNRKKNVFSLYGIVALVHELRDAVRGLWGLKEELHRKNNGLNPLHSDHQQQSATDVEKGVKKPETASPPRSVAPQLPPRLYPPGYEPNPESPFWLSLDYLGYGMVRSLREEEKEFWRFLIHKYLYPLDEDKNQKAKIAEDLAIIRNNVVFIYVMMNFLWCVIALQLQAMEDSLKMFYIVEKYEPLSLVFLAVFALVLLLQFLSMLVHRWGTFLHLMAATRVDWCKKSFSEEEFARYVVNQTKLLQTLEPSPDYDEEDDDFNEEESGMALSDFHSSLQHHDARQVIASTDQEGGGGGGGGSIYETLNHFSQFRYPYQTRLHRTASTSGQFPMLKTIFEQNLTNLQQRFQQRGAAPGQVGRSLSQRGTQRRYWGDRYGDMQQRFVHQNFQMPVHRGDRLFRRDGADIV